MIALVEDQHYTLAVSYRNDIKIENENLLQRNKSKTDDELNKMLSRRKSRSMT